MELTEQEVEGLIKEHIALGEEIKTLKAAQDAAKGKLTAWLDDKGAKRVSTHDFTATLTTRKGAFDKKAFQIAHGILD